MDTCSTDAELLTAYAEQGSEAAFSELVRRYVDFVYAVALRMAADPQIARDVTQCVFIALARQARQLVSRPVLSGWLYRTAHNLASTAVRAEVRRRKREQEAMRMISESNGREPDWQDIQPILDDGLARLHESDRDALLLRYFERKTAREVAERLGLSEEAAQKRIGRAVEKLRVFFGKRGVAVSGAGLAAVLAGHTAEAAPAGLGSAITAAVVISAPFAAASGAGSLAGITIMTTAQKLLVTASLTLVIGVGVYEGHKAWCLEKEKETVERQVEPGSQQALALRQERDSAMSQLSEAQQQLERLRRDIDEAARLRREVAALRDQVHALPRTKVAQNQSGSAASPMSLSERVTLLKRRLAQSPEHNIPELQLADDNDWLEVAAAVKTGSELDLRQALSDLRTLAKDKVAPVLGAALEKYTEAHDGQLPEGMADLKPYFESPMDDAILQRYEVAKEKRLSDLRAGQGAISERSRVDETDTLISITTDRYLQQFPPRVIEGTGGTKVTSEVRAVSLARKGQPKSLP
jgi:RNA polymerase sigma factor (sigma-70 family)